MLSRSEAEAKNPEPLREALVANAYLPLRSGSA